MIWEKWYDLDENRYMDGGKGVLAERMDWRRWRDSGACAPWPFGWERIREQPQSQKTGNTALPFFERQHERASPVVMKRKDVFHGFAVAPRRKALFTL